VHQSNPLLKTQSIPFDEESVNREDRCLVLNQKVKPKIRIVSAAMKMIYGKGVRSK